MNFFKNSLFLAKLAAIIGIILSIYVQIFTFINLANGHFSAELKTSIYLMTSISFIFVICSFIGIIFLFQKKWSLAGTILFISGLASIFFVHILAGTPLVISGILIKASQK